VLIFRGILQHGRKTNREKESSRGNTSVSGADAGIQRWKPAYHDGKVGGVRWRF